MKFKYKYLSQAQLGELFGVSSHVIGKWLAQIGLRDERTKKPTGDAHNGGFCETAPSGHSGYYWAWNSQKTVAALQDAGHAVVLNPPHFLVEPARLHGPFSVRKLKDGSAAVVNGDGSSAAWANTESNAAILMKLLTAAEQHGLLARLSGQQRPSTYSDKPDTISPQQNEIGEPPCA